MENELDPKRFKLRCLETLQRKKLLQSECFDSILVLFIDNSIPMFYLTVIGGDCVKFGGAGCSGTWFIAVKYFKDS